MLLAILFILALLGLWLLLLYVLATGVEEYKKKKEMRQNAEEERKSALEKKGQAS